MVHREGTRRPTDAELGDSPGSLDAGPSTVRAVAEHLGRAHAYTTILKLLQIMTRKGLVVRDETTRTHVYAAASSQEHTQRQLVQDLLDRAFEGSAAKLVVQALAETQVAPEELAEIRKLIRAKRGERR